MKLNVLYLGKCRYEKANVLQEMVFDLRRNGRIDDTLILFEPEDHVLTLGSWVDDAKESKLLKIPRSEIENQGIKFFRVGRGGYITHHFPGQIVGYPVIDLNSLYGKFDYMDKAAKNLKQLAVYKRQLMEMAKSVLSDYVGKDMLYIDKGLWYLGKGERCKMGAYGIEPAEQNGFFLTKHGFSLDVNTDVEAVNKLIYPCGYNNDAISLAKVIGRELNIGELAEKIILSFTKNFNYEANKISEDDLAEKVAA